jgi:hypothetical protein
MAGLKVTVTDLARLPLDLVQVGLREFNLFLVLRQ